MRKVPKMILIELIQSVLMLSIIILLIMQLAKPANAITVHHNLPVEVAKEDLEETINKGEWNLILINKDHPLPGGYTVELKQLNNGHAVDIRIYEDLQNMMDDARREGLSPMICSSYRTNEKQTNLYKNEIRQYQNQGFSTEEAIHLASKWVAPPGTSEHQAGLAVDIVSIYNVKLDNSQLDTAEQNWLIENCYRYGFILRYPEDKKEITGINFEPWHYRYVGKEAAKQIKEMGISLEEYVQNL